LEAEENSAIDFEVDEKIRELDRSLDSFVLDSRMAWKFVRGATHVFLSVSAEAAAYRVLNDSSRVSESYDNLESAVQALRGRRDSEVKRYKRLYGADIEDQRNYDLHVVTDNSAPGDSVALILAFVKNKTTHKNWIPKGRLVPMISIREASGVASTARYGLADQFKLPLWIQENFGFYWGSGRGLIEAFFYELAHVPYVVDFPKFLSTNTNVYELALSTLRSSDLYDWEATAGVNLEFNSALNLAKDDRRVE
jgi:cytidylate kinase